MLALGDCGWGDVKISFSKMQGCGNDFVVIDSTRQRFEPPPGLLAHLADRRFGVGCDQILVVEAPSADDLDFCYRIFNADGSEVGQCGNGARALARFVVARGLTDRRRLKVRTSTSTLELELLDDLRVRVNMGVPQLEPAQIPLAVAARQLDYPLPAAVDGYTRFGALSMGNPHAVIRVEGLDRTPVDRWGPAVQGCGLFPQGVNVGFMQIVHPGAVSLRVYERGSGETLACGSGACAAVVVGRLWGLLDDRVEVTLRGGRLHIAWAGEGSPVWMTGTAEFAFTGELEWKS